MNEKNIPDYIFDWLTHQSFEALTPSEQEEVLKWMTKEEFQDFKTIIGDFKDADEKLEIPPPSLNLKNQSSIRQKIFNLLNHPIPAYQVAASFLLIVGISWWLQFNNPSKKPIEGVKQVNQEGTTIEEEAYPEDLVFNL